MRPIISNDLKRIYGKLDYNLIERTRTSEKALVGATTISVINPTGISANDYLCIGDPGDDTSEIRQVSSISSKDITISSATDFLHDKSTNVYKIAYDQINFYGDATVIATASIKPDYLVSVPATISSSVAYSMSFYNSTTAVETDKGEAVYDTDKLLCSPADLYHYEDAAFIGKKAIEKIDIASRDIRNIFLGQSQNIKDVDNKFRLKSSCALLALKYILIEGTKREDDINAFKSSIYGEQYQSEINKIMGIINLEDDNIRAFSQTRALR